MRYFAQYEDGTLCAVGTGPGGVEITEEEYNALLEEIRANIPEPEPLPEEIDDAEALAIITGGAT